MLKNLEKKIVEDVKKDGIEAVYDRLRLAGYPKLANKLMAEYTEQAQEKQAERMRKLRKFYFDVIEYGCNYCENQGECRLYQNTVNIQKEVSVVIALSTILRCQILVNRVNETKTNEPTD